MQNNDFVMTCAHIEQMNPEVRWWRRRCQTERGEKNNENLESWSGETSGTVGLVPPPPPDSEEEKPGENSGFRTQKKKRRGKMENLRVYHGPIGKAEGERRLGQDGRDGCYLVRDSDSLPGVYCLCVL